MNWTNLPRHTGTSAITCRLVDVPWGWVFGVCGWYNWGGKCDTIQGKVALKSQGSEKTSRKLF